MGKIIDLCIFCFSTGTLNNWSVVFCIAYNDGVGGWRIFQVKAGGQRFFKGKKGWGEGLLNFEIKSPDQ